MAFTSLKLTTFGRTLNAKSTQGKGLHLSRVAIGDGLLGNGSMTNRTALVSEKLSMLIDAIQLTDAATVSAVIATLDNGNISAGFNFRELAIMGTDPDTSQEGVYLYDNAGEECEYLDTQANGVIIYERLKLLINTEATDNITFEASGNPLYLGVDDPVSGNTVTFTQAETRVDLQSGETLAVLLGKIKKWLASLGSAAFTEISAYAAATHASRHKTGGADALAPADIGAAAASHNHTKSQITDFPHKSTHAVGGTDALKSTDLGIDETTAAKYFSSVTGNETVGQVLSKLGAALLLSGGSIVDPHGNAVTIPSAQLDGRVQIYHTTYTGTGLYGSDHPNVVTFPFVPSLLILTNAAGRIMFSTYPRVPIGSPEFLTTEYQADALFLSIYSGNYIPLYAKKSADGKTISWYNGTANGSGPALQFNESGTVYGVWAIGQGG